MALKKRRARRKQFDWATILATGGKKERDAFYNSTDFDIVREQVLVRDYHECQFFAGKWNDGIHKPYKIEPKLATMVHHIKPIKERPDLCLDPNNLVSLSFEAHEIIEERARFRFKRKIKDKKIYSNSERW